MRPHLKRGKETGCFYWDRGALGWTTVSECTSTKSMQGFFGRGTLVCQKCRSLQLRKSACASQLPVAAAPAQQGNGHRAFLRYGTSIHQLEPNQTKPPTTNTTTTWAPTTQLLHHQVARSPPSVGRSFVEARPNPNSNNLTTKNVRCLVRQRRDPDLHGTAPFSFRIHQKSLCQILVSPRPLFLSF